MNVPPFIIGSSNQRDGILNFNSTHNPGVPPQVPNLFYPSMNMPINAFAPNINVAPPHNPIYFKCQLFVPSSVVGALIGSKVLFFYSN